MARLRSVAMILGPDRVLIWDFSVASSSVELLQAEWDGAGPVGGPFDLLPGRVT
jgi:hypothetical protein